jgi:hypothetical protein
MNHPCKTASLVAFVALLSAGPAFTQAPSDEATSETKAAAPVAYVYVQTTEGVNLYDAAANGKLTPVKGSPFKATGLMIGSNRKYFMTLGTNWVHSYAIESNGAIGEQVSTINTEDYEGSKCGTTEGAVLDRTGQSLYVRLFTNGAPPLNTCVTYQSFNIAKASGDLTFSDAVNFGVWDTAPGLPAFGGNNSHAYVYTYLGVETSSLAGFTRENDGALKNWAFKETDPTPPPGWERVYPWTFAPDSIDHFAIALYPTAEEDIGTVKLASYTADSAGNLTSTNTWKKMPTPYVYPGVLSISPSGKLLAIAGNGGCLADCSWPQGLEIFHFNGADPITPYAKQLTAAKIDQIQWDDNNHLYALSNSTNQLFVYTITPTTISEVAGSPYKIANPDALAVVPK